MGGIRAARAEGLLKTLLGSCIGVALYDRRLKLGALAHIVLPSSNGTSETRGKYADTAIPEMLRQLRELAPAEPLKPVAKIAGGANMFAALSTMPTIGEQNVQAVEQVLEAERILIVGRNLGGEQGRRMTLDVSTGLVTIEIVGADLITL